MDEETQTQENANVIMSLELFTLLAADIAQEGYKMVK